MAGVISACLSYIAGWRTIFLRARASSPPQSTSPRRPEPAPGAAEEMIALPDTPDVALGDKRRIAVASTPLTQPEASALPARPTTAGGMLAWGSYPWIVLF